MLAEQSSPPPKLSRRAFARGAAWAAPSALATVAAPAMAVSTECTPATNTSTMFGFGPAGRELENWTRTQSSGFPSSPTVAHRSAAYAPGTPAQALSNVLLQQDDPTVRTAVSTDVLRNAVCLRPGQYTFTIAWTLFGTNYRAAELDASLLDESTMIAFAGASSTVAAPRSSGHRSGTSTFSVRLTERKSVRFRYRWKFPEISATDWNYYTGILVRTYPRRFANDIAVQAPTVAYTP